MTWNHLTVVGLSLFFCCSVNAQTNTQRGAVAGGAAGAIIGGIIGNQNDETPEGILIGGALGALAGGVLGNDRDQQIRRQYHHQQQRQIAFHNGVSLQDVVSLSQSGVTSQVIINQVRTHGLQQRVGVNEIIALHQSGVDNIVIDALQKAPLAGSQIRQHRPNVYHPVPVPTYRPPTVIVDRVYVPRSISVYPQRRHSHHHRYGHGGRKYRR